jgi:hypothetical protein
MPCWRASKVKQLICQVNNTLDHHGKMSFADTLLEKLSPLFTQKPVLSTCSAVSLFM